MPLPKQNINVTVPHRSGANLSHRNSGTLTCGTLTPLLVEEVIAGTRCYLRVPEVVQLPPLVSDTYMNLKLKHEAFFVPFRLLCCSFESFFSDFPDTVGRYQNNAVIPALYKVRGALPVFNLDSTVSSTLYGPGSLMDYLGFKVNSIKSNMNVSFSPMSLIAYHLIWQEYYRNPRIQTPAFIRDMGDVDSSVLISYKRVASLPYVNYRFGATPNANANNVFIISSTNENTCLCADSVSIFSLRQRNFGLDYFTAARPSAQQGNPASVTIALPSGATETSFTVAQLRAANSLQQFRERNNLPSTRFVDQVYARYGVRLHDGVAQRPICIGSSSFDVVTRGVDQQAMSAATAGANPFHSVGSQYGRAFAVGDGTLIDDFEAKEPGFIIVLQSLVPDVSYSTGIAPYLKRYISDGSIVQMATPLLQNVGDEPITQDYLHGTDVNDSPGVFAYQDRYGTFLFHPNEIHAILRDGQSLAPFVLQRSFNVAPTFSTSFLEIPKNYLDGVFVTNSAISGFSAWYDAKLDWRISVPLAEFSIPSLQDPAYEHGQTISLRRNGQIF